MVCMGVLNTMHLFFKQFLQQHLKLRGGGGSKIYLSKETDGAFRGKWEKNRKKKTKTFIFGP